MEMDGPARLSVIQATQKQDSHDRESLVAEAKRPQGHRQAAQPTRRAGGQADDPWRQVLTAANGLAKRLASRYVQFSTGARAQDSSLHFLHRCCKPLQVPYPQRVGRVLAEPVTQVAAASRVP